MRVHDLNEAMSLSTARKVLQASKGPMPHEQLFQDHKAFQKGRQSNRLYFELDSPSEPEESEYGIAKNILSFIARPFSSVWPIYHEIKPSFEKYPDITQTYDLSDEKKQLYLKGLVKTDKGTTVRIGKLIQNQVDLFHSMTEVDWPPVPFLKDRNGLARSLYDNALKMKKQYDEDPVRAGAKLERDRLWAVICRHPYDIAGMSTGRGWTSCLNMEDGKDKRYIERHIRDQAMVAYLINKGDWNIRRPVSRILINVLRDDDDNQLLVADDTQQGYDSDIFEEFITNWCDDMNKGSPKGLYKTKNDAQYPYGIEYDSGHMQRVSTLRY